MIRRSADFFIRSLTYVSFSHGFHRFPLIYLKIRGKEFDRASILQTYARGLLSMWQRLTVSAMERDIIPPHDVSHFFHLPPSTL